MPAHAADLDTALQKKGGLTLSQLANYDDLITDALVDRVYFWSAIRKLKPNFHASRGIQEEAVCKILQRDVVIGRDAAMAHRNLLCLPGMTNYLRSLKTNDEKEHFERHLRKYVNMYLPECPFEVCTTNRYTILTHEACVVARRPIKQGEPIKFLSGIQVEMTEKEEEELSSRTDFSIVISSRRKRPSLFLGPARFANHDCDSNARLSTSGPHGIHIVARKSIAVGEEITVQYGDNYFGEDNCECLCASCEKAVRNGWDPKGPILHESDSESDDSDAEDERRSSRKTTPRPSKTTNGDLKRKRAGGDESEQPAKKGRLANSRTSLTNKPMSEAKAAKQAAQASQSAMTDWFSRRRDGDLDDDQLSNALAGLHDHIRSKTKPAKNRNSAKQVAERQTLFGSMIDLITATTTRKVAKVEREIHNLNGQVAAMMGIDVADVPRLCPTTAGKYRADLDKSDEDVEMSEAPQQEDHVKIEDADEDFSFTDHIPIGEEANEEEASEDEGPGILSASYTTFLRDFGKDGLRTLQNADRMQSGLSREIVDRYMTEAAHSMRDSRLEMQKRERNEQQNAKEKTTVLTDHLARTKPTQPSVKKERSQSNLRNVLNADEDVDVSIFDVPDSPEPVEARRESRERRTHGSGTKLAIHRSPRRVEATQNSTDSSSMSSVFSAEGRTGEASSLTSADHSPDRLDGFAAGSICQNIVEMYTTEPTPEDDETESERKKNEERVAGWSRGRLPVRKSIRRTTIDSPSQAMTSIEDNTAGEGEDDDEEECKRGPPRTPGDYYLTESLLVTTYHRWVECRNCDEFFVQAEAYLTRIACPRCERHSKLYGFHWPKTEREGRHDTEERVLDHRTIHRFIDPEDERLERKGKRGLAEVIRERETSSRMSEGLGEGGGGRVERLRSSPRRSESRRKTRHSMQ